MTVDPKLDKGGDQPLETMQEEGTVHPPSTIVGAHLGNRPVSMVCPHCQAEICTTVEASPGLIAYLSGLFLVMLGCVWGCCLIPCCMDECKDVEHTCPDCQGSIGNYHQ